MANQGYRLPAGQDWLLIRDFVIIDDGFIIVGKVLGQVGIGIERLTTDSLTTNIVPDLLGVT